MSVKQSIQSPQESREEWRKYYIIKRDLSIERYKHATTEKERTRQQKFVNVYNTIIKKY